jgi:hypothetical protein
MKMSNLSWKPIRRGSAYCSPACGRGCTVAEFNRATREAEKLAKRLSKVATDLPPGKWDVNVHENLGWFYSVSRGVVNVRCYRGTVYSHAPDYYRASVQTSGPWVTGQDVTARTPEQAVANLLAWMRVQLKPVVALAARLERNQT